MKKTRKRIAWILSLCILATLFSVPTGAIAAPPAGETYEAYDEVGYADLLDTGTNHLAAGGVTLTAQNNIFYHEASSETHSVIWKFRYVAGAAIYFQMFPGQYRSGNPFAYRLANATTWEKRYAPDAATKAVGYTVADGDGINLEIARLKVATGDNAGKYYTYLKADGVMVFESYVSADQIGSTDLNDSIQLNLNGSNSCMITATAAFEEETFCEYDEVNYEDLRIGGAALPTGGIGLESTRDCTYAATSDTYSAVLRFRWTAGDASTWKDGEGQPKAGNYFVLYYDAWSGSAYPFSLAVKGPNFGGLGAASGANGAWHIAPNQNGNIVQMDEPIVPGQSYDIEFGRLKVATGTHRDKYFVFLSVDGEMIFSYYYSDVSSDGTYNSGKGTLSNKILFTSGHEGDSISQIPDSTQPVDPDPDALYYAYDEVSYYDLRDGGSPLGTETQLGTRTFTYDKTSPTGSVILKYRWRPGQEGTKFQLSFDKKGDGVCNMFGAQLYAPGGEGSHAFTNNSIRLRPGHDGDAGWAELASNIVANQEYNVEFARLKVKNGENAGKYYVYFKLDDQLVSESYVAADVVSADGKYTQSGTEITMSNEIYLTFWGGGGQDRILAIPEPETYYEFDEVNYEDLRIGGAALPTGGIGLESTRDCTYAATSATYSAVLKFRWTAGDASTWKDGEGQPKAGNYFVLYYDAWAGSAYPFSLAVKGPNFGGLGAASGENGAWHIAPNKNGNIVQMDEPIVPGQSYDIEFGRQKVATGPNKDKYFVSLKVDGEMIFSYYYDDVNADGTYNGGTGTLSNKILFTSGHEGDSISQVTVVTPVEPEISTASVTVGSDLTLNVGAQVGSDVTAPVMVFTCNGEETEVNGIKEGDAWTFEYGGIYSQQMTDTIQMKLMDGETVLKEESYSIQEYFDRLHSSTASELGLTDESFAALKTLLADTLEYGTMAQNYADYMTSKPANSLSWVAAEKTQSFTAPATDKAIKVLSFTSDRIISASLSLANDVRFRFSVGAQNADRLVFACEGGSTTVMLADCIKEGETYLVCSEGMNATDFDTVWTVTLTDAAGNIYSQVEYSVNSYVASKCESENVKLAQLVKAMYNYGVSADAYQQIPAAGGMSVGNEDTPIDNVDGGGGF
ncbi:MAG: hypothetical protein IJS22_08165 [Lachnospiraceae bacterium]|nr:hypothetical protein [Lachnospiraceae bacterium]